MSFRTRRPRLGIRTRLGRLVEGEERQQTVVSVLFVAAIAAVIVILVGAIALSYYNDNIRPLARVGSFEVGPQITRDRLNLEQWRLTREQNRITQAQIEGELDAAEAQTRLAALDQRAQALGSTGLEELIDIVYQAQLAAQEGITVSDAEVDQRLTKELAGVERRQVLMITVEPQAADAEAGPTSGERRTALEQAEAALAQLETGATWADVARQYGTDDVSKAGGDLGLISPNRAVDLDFSAAVFDLEAGGTTEIVRGSDGAYRIGRVTEINTAAEDPGLRRELLAEVAEPSVRDLLRYEIASDRLKDKITDAALADTPDQVRIAVIFIDGLFSGDPADADGEVDYSEIVFAPNDDLVDAPDLPADDPAWELAKFDADARFRELELITDLDERQVRFEELATEVSDSPSADDAGSVGFVTRSIPPDQIADALFEGTHQKGDLIGPIKGDAAWYVLIFQERRASPEDRVAAVETALAQPGADFNEVALALSEGPEQDDGGEVGWLSRDQLTEELADDIFALTVGQVSDALELGNGHYFVKLEERAVRALDADQIPNVRFSAFENWYTDKKDAAEADGTIVRAGEEGLAGGDLQPGSDQGTP